MLFWRRKNLQVLSVCPKERVSKKEVISWYGPHAKAASWKAAPRSTASAGQGRLNGAAIARR